MSMINMLYSYAVSSLMKSDQVKLVAINARANKQDLKCAREKVEEMYDGASEENSHKLGNIIGVFDNLENSFDEITKVPNYDNYEFEANGAMNGK